MRGEFNGFFLLITNNECLSSVRFLSGSGYISLHFVRALAASCVLYNRTEHSQGFFIC